MQVELKHWESAVEFEFKLKHWESAVKFEFESRRFMMPLQHLGCSDSSCATAHPDGKV